MTAPSEVDFVVVGVGAAGGIIVRELAAAGFTVVALEQGPFLHEADFHHDELATRRLAALTNDFTRSPNTYRMTDQEVAKPKNAVSYGRVVGGGTVHYTGNLWRFHEIDFIERSRRGSLAGSAMADWPITYADLEPYYTRVEWEVGVSGLAGASPFDPPRSKPYPLPPIPIKSTGVLLERAAKQLGWTAFPAPHAAGSRGFPQGSAAPRFRLAADPRSDGGPPLRARRWARRSTRLCQYGRRPGNGHRRVDPEDPGHRRSR